MSKTQIIENTIAIEAIAEIRQIKTMADFSGNVVLNFGENQKNAIKWFLDNNGKLIKLVAVVED